MYIALVDKKHVFIELLKEDKSKKSTRHTFLDLSHYVNMKNRNIIEEVEPRLLIINL